MDKKILMTGLMALMMVSASLVIISNGDSNVTADGETEENGLWYMDGTAGTWTFYDQGGLLTLTSNYVEMYGVIGAHGNLQIWLNPNTSVFIIDQEGNSSTLTINDESGIYTQSTAPIITNSLHIQDGHILNNGALYTFNSGNIVIERGATITNNGVTGGGADQGIVLNPNTNLIVYGGFINNGDIMADRIDYKNVVRTVAFTSGDYVLYANGTPVTIKETTPGNTGIYCKDVNGNDELVEIYDEGGGATGVNGGDLTHYRLFAGSQWAGINSFNYPVGSITMEGGSMRAVSPGSDGGLIGDSTLTIATGATLEYDILSGLAPLITNLTIDAPGRMLHMRDHLPSELVTGGGETIMSHQTWDIGTATMVVYATNQGDPVPGIPLTLDGKLTVAGLSSIVNETGKSCIMKISANAELNYGTTKVIGDSDAILSFNNHNIVEHFVTTIGKWGMTLSADMTLNEGKRFNDAGFMDQLTLQDDFKFHICGMFDATDVLGKEYYLTATGSYVKSGITMIGATGKMSLSGPEEDLMRIFFASGVNNFILSQNTTMTVQQDYTMDPDEEYWVLVQQGTGLVVADGVTLTVTGNVNAASASQFTTVGTGMYHIVPGGTIKIDEIVYFHHVGFDSIFTIHDGILILRSNTNGGVDADLTDIGVMHLNEGKSFGFGPNDSMTVSTGSSFLIDGVLEITTAPGAPLQLYGLGAFSFESTGALFVNGNKIIGFDGTFYITSGKMVYTPDSNKVDLNGNVELEKDFKIPEGYTFNVNGELTVNAVLTVAGTLVIDAGTMVNKNKVVITETGILKYATNVFAGRDADAVFSSIPDSTSDPVPGTLTLCGNASGDLEDILIIGSWYLNRSADLTATLVIGAGDIGELVIGNAANVEVEFAGLEITDTGVILLTKNKSKLTFTGSVISGSAKTLLVDVSDSTLIFDSPSGMIDLNVLVFTGESLEISGELRNRNYLNIFGDVNIFAEAPLTVHEGAALNIDGTATLMKATPITTAALFTPVKGTTSIYSVKDLYGTADTDDGLDGAAISIVAIEYDGWASPTGVPPEILLGYSVYFLVDIEGEMTLTVTTMAVGQAVTFPADPVWAGHRFMGWVHMENPASPVIPSAGVYNESFFAMPVWEEIVPPKVTVTLDNGLGNITLLQVTDGGIFTFPVNPVNPSGYTFKGWDVNGTLVTDKTVTINGDTTITAIYEVLVFHTVTVDTAQGISYQEQVTDGGSFTIPNAPVAPAGYTFSGWYVGTVKIVDPTITVTGDVMITAHYEVIVTWTVTVDTAQGLVFQEEVTDGGSFTVPNAPVAPAGYTFSGWYVGTVKIVDPTITVTNDVIVTAHYEVIVTWTVTVDTAQGLVFQEEVANGGIFTIPNAPAAPAGYTFSGWYVGTVKIVDPTMTVTEDVTMTAHYEVIVTWTVTVDTARGLVFQEEVANGGIFTIPNAPTAPAGYTFSGWYVGTVKIETPTITVTGNVTITAHYEPMSIWTVRVVVNDATSFQEQVADGESFAIPDTPIPPAGYTFSGWYVGTVKIETPTITVTGNVTITAHYEKIIVWTVTVDTAQGISYQEQVANGGIFTIPNAPVAPEGYTFSGWYNGPVKIETSTVTVTSNMTLTAHYEKIVVWTVTVVVSNSTSFEEQVTDGGIFTVPDAPVAPAGYTFKGWYIGTVKIETDTITVTGNVTITAQYDEIVIWTVTVDTAQGLSFQNHVADGGLFTVPGNPVAPYGSTFDGWYIGEEKITTLSIVINGNTAIVAHYSVIPGSLYTVTVDNGQGSVNWKEVTAGSSFAVPANPIAPSGYAFDGWFIGDTKVTTETVIINEDTTLLAKYTHVNTPADNTMEIVQIGLIVVVFVAIMAMFFFKRT